MTGRDCYTSGIAMPGKTMLVWQVDKLLAASTSRAKQADPDSIFIFSFADKQVDLAAPDLVHGEGNGFILAARLQQDELFTPPCKVAWGRAHTRKPVACWPHGYFFYRAGRGKKGGLSWRWFTLANRQRFFKLRCTHIRPWRLTMGKTAPDLLVRLVSYSLAKTIRVSLRSKNGASSTCRFLAPVQRCNAYPGVSIGLLLQCLPMDWRGKRRSKYLH